ncbi:MAG: calcium/sodium antiporter [Bacteroidales bacterium]
MFILAGGLVLLIYGASLMVDSASALARSLRIPDIVIGLTIVAFGTSAPELAVNIFAALQNSSGIAIGNVTGSNLFNVMVILGFSAAVFPLTVKSNTTWIEIPLCLLAALVLLVMANDIFLEQSNVSKISRTEGLILLTFFLIFLAYNFQLAKKGDVSDDLVVKTMGKTKSVILIIAGLILLVAGGRLIVNAAISIARDFGMSERIIALTIISAGTSLPELATSIVAAFKKNTDIAIGNIVGSNIFNVFLVLGVTAVINPVDILPGANVDMMLNVLISLLLFIFIFTGKGRRINRTEGIIFLLMYGGYLFYLLR